MIASVAVNPRMFPPELTAEIPRRKFGGADSGSFIE